MMKDSKVPFYGSKFPWGREIISPKIIDFLRTRYQNGLLALI
jgi:hypothetical protein